MARSVGRTTRGREGQGGVGVGSIGRQRIRKQRKCSGTSTLQPGSRARNQGALYRVCVSDALRAAHAHRALMSLCTVPRIVRSGNMFSPPSPQPGLKALEWASPTGTARPRPILSLIRGVPLGISLTHPTYSHIQRRSTLSFISWSARPHILYSQQAFT